MQNAVEVRRIERPCGGDAERAVGRGKVIFSQNEVPGRLETAEKIDLPGATWTKPASQVACMASVVVQRDCEPSECRKRALRGEWGAALLERRPHVCRIDMNTTDASGPRRWISCCGFDLDL